MIPLYKIYLTSLSSQAAITRAGGLVLIPAELTVDAYRQVLSGGIVTRAALVSLGATSVGAAISVTVSVLAADRVPRPRSLFHTPNLFLMLGAMLVGAGMITLYLLV